MLTIAKTVKEVRQYVTERRKSGATVGFVPTMGYLHEGHGSLIKRSVRECDVTVVSIFVNPTQFSPNEDLSTYPRDFEADKALCEECGADLIFAPENSEMYCSDFTTYVECDGVTQELCGKSRPTHFRGVCTVVSKLFNIVQPDIAYFGQKDAQQLAVIKRMVRDLNMNVKIVGCPIIRETDGLAKSSRNSYLSDAERQAATVLSKAVLAGEKLLNEGMRDALEIIVAMRKIIETEPIARIDYVDVVDATSMKRVSEICGDIVGAVAVFIGKTRLIDNFLWKIGDRN